MPARQRTLAKEERWGKAVRRVWAEIRKKKWIRTITEGRISRVEQQQLATHIANFNKTPYSLNLQTCLNNSPSQRMWTQNRGEWRGDCCSVGLRWSSNVTFSIVACCVDADGRVHLTVTHKHVKVGTRLNKTWIWRDLHIPRIQIYYQTLNGHSSKRTLATLIRNHELTTRIEPLLL